VIFPIVSACRISSAVLALAAGGLALQTDALGDLLARLSEHPLSESTLFAIERQAVDPRTKPALARSFASATSKREKQWIALTLVHLGSDSDAYSDFLAGYATEAIDDPAPYFAAYDASGRQLRGVFSPTFESWCAINGKNPREVAALQTYDQPEDVLILARASLAQWRNLLRRGVRSKNPQVVAYSAQGLARLHDAASIALVAQVAERLPRSEALTVAMQLPWYGTSDADALMQKLVPDLAVRTFYTRQVRARQALEMGASAQRSAASPQK
jgi:hypothetical protein